VNAGIGILLMRRAALGVVIFEILIYRFLGVGKSVFAVLQSTAFSFFDFNGTTLSDIRDRSATLR